MYLFKIIAILSLMFSISFIETIYAASDLKVNPIKEKVLIGKEIETTKHININTADAETLQTLKGIGAKRAQEIINYRNKNGEFKKIEDLKSIKGFTNKFLVKLQKDNPDFIEINSKKTT